MSLGSDPLLFPLRLGVANVLSDSVVVCWGECFLCLRRYFNNRTTRVMMMMRNMMDPEAIPANKATSEPRILECPALLPSELGPRDKVGRKGQRGETERERSKFKMIIVPSPVCSTERLDCWLNFWQTNYPARHLGTTSHKPAIHIQQDACVCFSHFYVAPKPHCVLFIYHHPSAARTGTDKAAFDAHHVLTDVGQLKAANRDKNGGGGGNSQDSLFPCHFLFQTLIWTKLCHCALNLCLEMHLCCQVESRWNAKRPQ